MALLLLAHVYTAPKNNVTYSCRRKISLVLLLVATQLLTVDSLASYESFSGALQTIRSFGRLVVLFFVSRAPPQAMPGWGERRGEWKEFGSF